MSRRRTFALLAQSSSPFVSDGSREAFALHLDFARAHGIRRGILAEPVIARFAADYSSRLDRTRGTLGRLGVHVP
jgi:hypothetical protein